MSGPAAKRDYYLWRMIATGLSFTLFGIGGLLLGYLLLPLISLLTPDRDRAVRRCRYLIHLCFRGFIGFMQYTGVLTWHVRDGKSLRSPGQLVIANHPTLIDVVFLIAQIPNATCIVKADLYRNVFTRGPVSRAGYVPNNSPEQLVADGSAQLAQGASLIVFPEGTRSVQDKALKFRRGAAYLWLAARCPIALVTISSNPPTLAKGEKWYQIPPCRPHFELAVDSDKQNQPINGPDSQQARAVTRQWQQYFSQEIST